MLFHSLSSQYVKLDLSFKPKATFIRSQPVSSAQLKKHGQSSLVLALREHQIRSHSPARQTRRREPVQPDCEPGKRGLACGVVSDHLISFPRAISVFISRLQLRMLSLAIFMSLECQSFLFSTPLHPS